MKPASAPLRYMPALDGLRAICLFAVLLFHSGFAWASGGFLGVSTFFTLSGYLITSILLVEWDSSGAVSLAAFWRRRLRRLMPAALVGIAATLLSSPLWLDEESRARLAGDALAAVTYLINWRFVRHDYAYEAIFVAPSPLQHFWSLAIEAQFYLVFPIALGMLLRHLGPRRLAWVLGLAALASVAIAFAFPLTETGIARIYYGTDTRLAEILFGALLAVGLHGASDATPRRIAPVVVGSGPLALLALAAAWARVDVGDAALYRGGFGLYALVSTWVVAAIVAGEGPVARLLSRAWLRWVGRISYGAYVYHWPIFLVLDEDTTGLSGLLLFGARTVATLAVAEASFRWIEVPVRDTGSRSHRLFGWAIAPAVTGCALLAIAVAPRPAGETLSSVLGKRRSLPATTEAAPALRVGLLGGAPATALSPALASWAEARDDVRYVPTRGEAEAEELDVAVMVFEPAEDRSAAETESEASTLRARVKELISSGTHVLLLTVPRPIGSDPAAADRVNTLLFLEARLHPHVRLVDVAGFVAESRGAEGDTPSAEALVHELVGPRIVDLKEVQKARQGGGVRVGLFGDSVAYSLRSGLEAWASNRSDADFVLDATDFGCGILEEGERSTDKGRWAPTREECANGPDRWREAATANEIDLAVVLIGAWDARQRHFGTAHFDETVSESLGRLMAALVDSGTDVVWLTLPQFGVGARVPERGRAAAAAAADPERARRLNDLFRAQASAFPEVRIVDLARFMEERSGTSEYPLRPDRLHFSREGSIQLTDEWLGDELSAQANETPSASGAETTAGVGAGRG